ncbi:PREDICTED: spondin-1-like isoform X1 [Papilio xuthus]|uniref:Spondin-1-like isoform X1 n=1 Tax=Papilio xuthus TaxID=66420 RepID=A0AAJ6ZPS3_PAPXU|nr:PREDICTED: spondin-1-like isoform X1 [Papilio xuthus]
MNSIIFLGLFLLLKSEVFGFRCDRRPYGSITKPSAADGRFKLTVIGAEDTYMPDQLYTVQITSTDGGSRFTGFMISADGATKPDPSNPRRTIAFFPGHLRPQDLISAKFSDRCLYSVEHAIASPKTSVEVYWQAPESGNGCVTLRAMVVETDEVWFEDGPPLTQRLCEDMRQPDDVTPQLNYDCQICDEAKYEIAFTGIWSRNTHPRLYPEKDWEPRYSDLVGASHAIDCTLWAPGALASDGFKELAEHANTSRFEGEIREQIGSCVRTMVKGKGHGYPKMNNPTYAFIRADKRYHLISVAVGVHPSPDWFLGVTRFELCQNDNTWVKERELNLFPWDAGTDSGVSYESMNIATFPQDVISRVQMSSFDKDSPFYETDMKELHPFGRLRIKLVRTYHKDCEEEGKDETTVTEEEKSTTEEVSSTTTEVTTTETEADTEEPSPSEPDAPSRYQNTQLGSGERARETPIVTDPESPEDCPMSQWQEWSECEGECIDGQIVGYRWRERYHLVDGVAVEKYDPHVKHKVTKEVPRFCKLHYDTFEREECEDKCSDDFSIEEPTVERHVMEPIAPGYPWQSKKRNVFKF